LNPIVVDDKVIGASFFGKDITRRIKSEEALKESETQLRELNVTKDKLFSIIAHDLRSPFNSILGFSELLIENAKNSDIVESEMHSRIINSSAKNTLILLDNLLDWAKSQTGQISFKPEKINLLSIIQEIIESSNLMAKIKNISLNLIQSEEIEAYADANMVKTVLRNLISNAIKFTNPGGNINVNGISEQNQVEISISDNGIGMNDETRKKLFDISSNITFLGTTKEKGSGLGLVLCKEFVERLGGHIWVESEEGKGSDFRFSLPLNKT
jgi:signal transduction histidine kinase